MSEKVTAMIEEIKGLTVLELSELVHALEEVFGVSAAAMAAPAAGAAAPAAEEKTEFDVVLTGFDAAQKIKVIKVIREVMGLGLAEAKAAVEGAPHHEGGPVQGGRRGSEEAGRGSRRQGRAEVSFLQAHKKTGDASHLLFLCFPNGRYQMLSPAALPLLHAHCRLYPPQSPSISSTSPQA